MKRMCYIFFLLLVFMINSLVLAKEDIYISDVVMKNADGKEEKLDESVFSSDSINFNIRFEEVKDEVNYEVIIKNSSNKDYMVELKKDFLNSEYFSYEYTFNGGDSIIDANSTKTINIKINYKKEVEEAKLVNGVFNEDNHFEFSLIANSASSVINPKTGGIISIVIIFVLVIVSLIMVLFFRFKTKGILIGTNIILIGLISLPLFVFAIDSFEINVNTTIKVDKAGYFYVYHSSDNTVEKFHMSDYQNKTLNITSLVKDKYLYAGYYRDYPLKGSYKGDGVEVKDGTPYEGSPNIWGGDYYTESGLSVVPERGKTYYLKEIKDGYLRCYTQITFNNNSNKINRIFFISALDDSKYKKNGFIINNELIEKNSFNPYIIFTNNSTGEVNEHLTAASMFGESGITDGVVFLYNNDSLYVKENLSITIIPFLVTPDNVYVESYVIKKMNTGDLIKDGGFNFGYYISNKDRKVMDYSSH